MWCTSVLIVLLVALAASPMLFADDGSR